jgi:hypothetical protein
MERSRFARFGTGGHQKLRQDLRLHAMTREEQDDWAREQDDEGGAA